VGISTHKNTTSPVPDTPVILALIAVASFVIVVIVLAIIVLIFRRCHDTHPHPDSYAT
jgi:hypothetical protein